MQKLRISLLAVILLFSLSDLWAFCGFYVAKTDASLFNNTSQVIIVRDGIQTTVTMSSDFKGDVKDFAMVVPVPTVLKKKQVRTINPNIFTRMDGYSAPRLAEYYDSRQCPYNGDEVTTITRMDVQAVSLSSIASRSRVNRKKYKVKVEEEFSVDEYDIVILSAKESDGLERWLIDNGYKIPEGAQEVLEPYIQSKMKFFVVKVNMEKVDKSPSAMLSPLQITYTSNNFMLPIRLGMANADGDQDMLVYTFTKKGRVETTNYKMDKIPTDRYVPYFVKDRFGEFYKDLFDKSWKREGGNSVWLEYSWDLSATNPVKCDPCNSSLLTYNELKEAGVWWLASSQWGQYQGNLFMTRMHVRYNRSSFPQDLAFQITPNTERYQGRYILRRPAPGPFDCEPGQEYVKNLAGQRSTEVYELASLTGWKPTQFEDYIHHYDSYIKKSEEDGHGSIDMPVDGFDVGSTASAIEKSDDPEYMVAGVTNNQEQKWIFLPLIIAAILMVLGLSRKRKRIG